MTILNVLAPVFLLIALVFVYRSFYNMRIHSDDTTEHTHEHGGKVHAHSHGGHTHSHGGGEPHSH